MGMASCWFNSFDKPPQPDALLQIQKLILNYAAVSICTPESHAYLCQSLMLTKLPHFCVNCESVKCRKWKWAIPRYKKEKKTAHTDSTTLQVAQRGQLKSTSTSPKSHDLQESAAMQFWHVTRRWCCYSQGVTQHFWRNAGRVRKSQAVTCASPLCSYTTTEPQCEDS